MKMENSFFEKEEQKKKSFFEKFKSKVGRGFRTLLMASMLFSPLRATEGKIINIGDKDNKSDTELPVDMNNHQGSEFFDVKEGEVEKDKNFEKINLSPTFIQINPETNKKEFNWMSLVAPFDFTISTVENKNYTTTFTVPYEYARLFSEDPKAEKETNSEDYKLLSEHIKTELQTELKNAFHGFGFSENVYNANHPGELEDQSIKVEYMRVVGMTSPEGHVDKGKESIIPGNVDEENIELGHTRASAAERMTIEELNKLGVNTDEIESFLREQGSVENQFSGEEMERLAELAQDYEGVDDIEKIFKLYQDYNQGKIQDQNVVNELDRIIASKRCVQIEIGLQGERRIIVAVPVFFMLLLPLAWRRRNSKPEVVKKEDSKGGPKPEPALDGQDGQQEKIGEEPGLEKDPNILDNVPERVIKTELPENPEDYKYMESETIEDLYIGFDNLDNIKLGIDYRGIFNEYYEHYDKFKNIGGDLEIAIAYEILMSWKKHDIANRKIAGLSNPEEGMDYENNERQIQWSKMHARKFIQIMERMKKNELIKNKSELKEEESWEQKVDTLNEILDKLDDKQIFEERKKLNEVNNMPNRGREDNRNFIIEFLTKTAPSLLETTNTYLINKYKIGELQKSSTEKKEEDSKDINDFKKRFYDNFINFKYKDNLDMEELMKYLEIIQNADKQLSLIESAGYGVKLEEKIVINFRATINRFLSGINERIEDLKDPLSYLTVEYRGVRNEKMEKWLNE